MCVEFPIPSFNALPGLYLAGIVRIIGCADLLKDGFPSNPTDYATGARRPQIRGVYLSDLPGYRPKVHVEEKRVGLTKLDTMPSRMSSSQGSTFAMQTFPTDRPKQTKDCGIAKKKAAPRGGISPGSKDSHVIAAAPVFDN